MRGDGSRGDRRRLAARARGSYRMSVAETSGGRDELTAVGSSVRRFDGPSKVAGQARYVGDYVQPGMLHAAVARGIYPHARLVQVETGAARAGTGVVAVFSGADLERSVGERVYSGPAFADQPILAVARVRYAGEPVAVVVAESRAAALEAAQKVQIEYEELPAVHDARAAIEPDAPLVHDVLRPSMVFRDLAHLAGRSATNVCYDFHLRR